MNNSTSTSLSQLSPNVERMSYLQLVGLKITIFSPLDLLNAQRKQKYPINIDSKLSSYMTSGASILTAITINCSICNNPGKLITFSEVQLQLIAFSELQLQLIANLYSQFQLIGHPEKKDEFQ